MWATNVHSRVTTIEYFWNINVVYFVDYSSTFVFLNNNININIIPDKTGFYSNSNIMAERITRITRIIQLQKMLEANYFLDKLLIFRNSFICQGLPLAVE